MSKSGRYSADRKKIEALSASKTVEVSDCGTIFTLNEATALTTVTLPAASSAGNGWWCRFVLGSLDGGVNVDITIAVNTADADKFFARIECPVSGAAANGNDGIKFDTSACAVGDYVEVYTDATNWYAMGQCSGSAALLAHNA